MSRKRLFLVLSVAALAHAFVAGLRTVKDIQCPPEEIAGSKQEWSKRHQPFRTP